MMATAVLFGFGSTYVGLLVSYNFDTAAGATIVLVATILFFVVLVADNLRDGLRPRHSAAGWGHE